MAKAKKTSRSEQTTRVETVPVTTYRNEVKYGTKLIHEVVLTLTPDEAKTLFDLSRDIGGDPDRTRRKHTDAVGDALYAAGVRATPYRDRDYVGGITFKAPALSVMASPDQYGLNFVNSYGTNPYVTNSTF